MLCRITLYTHTVGCGDDLVLLHGWGMHSGIWHSLLPELSRNFRITCIDLPGFGQSSLLSSYDIEEVAEAILSVSPEHATYIGWSLGGLLGLKIAIDHPERVNKLVCVASTPRFIAADDWPAMKKEHLLRFGENLNEDIDRTLWRFLQLQLHGCENQRELLRSLKQNLLNQQNVSRETLSQSLELLFNTDLRDDLKDISNDCCYIMGRLDAIVPLALGNKIQSLNPDITVHTIDKSAHMPFLSHRDAFIKIIREFHNE